MPRDTIYYKEWIEQGWTWYLEIIPADNTPMPVTPETEELDINSLNIVGPLNSKFTDKFPIGITAADLLKIEFDLRYCPHDLIEYLTNPIASSATHIEFWEEEELPDVDLFIDVFVTNIFKLYTDKGSGGELELFYIGAQKKTLARKRKTSMNGIKLQIDIVFLPKLCLENVTPKAIYSYFRGGISAEEYVYYSKKYGLDLIWTIDTLVYGTGDVLVTNETDDFNALFVKFEDLDDTIIRLMQLIAKAWLRSTELPTINQTNNPFIAFQFFKQDYSDELHAPGASLNYEDLYFIGFVTMYSGWNIPVGGFLYNEKDMPTIFNYNNAWDYWRDLIEGNYCKLIFKPNADFYDIKFHRLFISATLDEKTVAFDDANGDEVELDENSIILHTAKAELKGLNSDDISKFEFVNEGSLADDDYDINKCIFHNLPTLIDASEEMITWDVNYSTRINILLNAFIIILNLKGFNYNKIYYKDTFLEEENVFIKIHEVVELRDGINTYNSFEEYSPLHETGWGAGYIDSVTNIDIQEIQKKSNSALAVATAIATTFSKINQSFWEPEFNMSDGIDILQLGNLLTLDRSVAYLPYNSELPVNMYNYLSSIGQWLEIEMDLKKGKVKTKIFIGG